MASAFYRFPHFGEKQRGDVCALCAAQTGLIVGRMNYTGLGEWDVVQCPDCGLLSYDPIPGIDIIARGCHRHYLHEQAGHSRRRLLRYMSRSYRRGGFFARKHLRRLDLPASPSVLEIGAGNGYFSQGIRRIYPGARIHYLDIMPERLPYYRGHFDCEAVAGEFSAAAFPDHQFDLIIARDILEHVRDPVQTLRDAHSLLKPGGLLFFITPNGREDFWQCSQRFKHRGASTLAWQNHFHFYLPETLHRMLEVTGFREEVAFKWNLTLAAKGIGHQEMPGLAVETIPDLNEGAPATSPAEKWTHDVTEVTGPWRHNLGWLSRLYSAWVDRYQGRVGFYDPAGKEFLVIARKPR